MHKLARCDRKTYRSKGVSFVSISLVEAKKYATFRYYRDDGENGLKKVKPAHAGSKDRVFFSFCLRLDFEFSRRNKAIAFFTEEFPERIHYTCY